MNIDVRRPLVGAPEPAISRPPSSADRHAVSRNTHQLARVRARDWLLCGLVCLATLLTFGVGAQDLGFYSDDAGFLTTLPNQGIAETLRLAAAYVPGRNLHVIWQQVLFIVAGSSPESLGRLHMAQTALDTICVGLAYVLARQIGLAPTWSFVASALFAFFPNHGETHFWLSAAPMNLASTAFALAYAWLVVRGLQGHDALAGLRVPFVLLAEVTLFAAALFTYDQTVFVLFALIGIRVLASIARRRLGFAAGMTAISLACLGFYAHLKANPSSGPTLTNVTVAHMLDTVKVSASMSFGPILQSSIEGAIQAASDTDRTFAVLVAIVFVIVGGFFVVVGDGKRDPEGLPARSDLLSRLGSHASFRLCVVLVCAGVWTVLAYGPSYIWFISPRHNYLPTVGLAFVVASAGALVTSIGGPRVTAGLARLLGLAVIAVAGVWLSMFVTADLSEKGSWIEAYRLRRTLYSDLIDTSMVANKTAIVFENFPSSIGSAPFFGQENHLALDYLYPAIAHLSLSAVSSISTDRGYFLDTELDRYGVAARFVPRERVIHLAYRGHTADRMLVDVGGDGVRAADLYSVTPDADQAAVATGISGAVVRGGADDPSLSVNLALPAAPTSADGQLALIIRTRDGDAAAAPLYARNPYGERILVPVVVPPSAPGTPTAAQMSVHLRGLARGVLESADVYVFSESAPQLLQAVPIQRRAADSDARGGAVTHG